MKLSFVIPAYNASETINRCLDSIYALPFTEDCFEVIVVDDCSIDNTLAIINDYATRHKNMRVLHQIVNRRQGAARNRGVAEATGDYVMFVDADDAVAAGLVPAMDFAVKSGVDMLFCSTSWENESHQFLPREYDIPEHVVMTGQQFAEKYYDILCTTAWTFLWNRTFLNDSSLPFIENRRMEDFDFIEQHVVKAKKIAYSSPVIYYYHFNLGSTIRSTSYDILADQVHTCYRRWIFCETLSSDFSTFVCKIDFQCRYFVNSLLSIRRLTRYTGADVWKIFNRIGKEELKYIYTKGNWSFFTQLCLSHQKIVVSLISIIHPIAELMRGLKRNFKD